MLYAKIENDKITYISSNSNLEYDGKITINPKEEDFLNAGYQTLPESEKPENESGYFYTSKYEIIDGQIAQTWTKIAYPSSNEEAENESI
ncbi:MAG: hypothetical protein R3Y46_07980 [Opitutales bacterium]